MKTDTDVYLETIKRIEPEIAMIDAGAFYASAAISLKRIAEELRNLRIIEMSKLTDTQVSLVNSLLPR
jgi:hypothetical protein